MIERKVDGSPPKIFKQKSILGGAAGYGGSDVSKPLGFDQTGKQSLMGETGQSQWEEVQDFTTLVVLQPTVSCGEMTYKSQFIKYLSSGLLLVVAKDVNTIQVWNLKRMQIETEIENAFKVTCATGCSEYYFIGLENNRILVHRTIGH